MDESTARAMAARGNPKVGHYRSQSSTEPAKSAAKSATQWEDDSESEYSSDYDSGSSYASGAKTTLPTRALCSRVASHPRHCALEAAGEARGAVE